MGEAGGGQDTSNTQETLGSGLWLLAASGFCEGGWSCDYSSALGSQDTWVPALALPSVTLGKSFPLHLGCIFSGADVGHGSDRQG